MSEKELPKGIQRLCEHLGASSYCPDDFHFQHERPCDASREGSIRVCVKCWQDAMKEIMQ